MTIEIYDYITTGSLMRKIDEYFSCVDKECAKPILLDILHELFSVFPCAGCSEVGSMFVDAWNDITNKIMGKPYNRERYEMFINFINNVNNGTAIKE